MSFLNKRNIIIFFSPILLLIIFSFLSKANPPFDGTIFISPDIITEKDPTTFQSILYTGQGTRSMYDRRSGWVSENAFLFDAKFSDLPDIEIQVNPEFSSVENAQIEAQKYAMVIGRIPKCLRKDVQTVWIHKGNNPFGGGNNNLLIHTEQGEDYIKSGILEETFVHEAAHTSLDSYHANNEEWLNAQLEDGNFISTYAQEHPFREDIAESFLPYFALKYRSDRISTELAKIISTTIPNRIKYFEKQDFGLDDSTKVSNNLWSDTKSLNSGWKKSVWFGTFYEQVSGWIYHMEMGWTYLKGEKEESLWLFQNKQGWLWTNKDIFPFLYQNKTKSWTYFIYRNQIPRFYDFSKKVWK